MELVVFSELESLILYRVRPRSHATARPYVLRDCAHSQGDFHRTRRAFTLVTGYPQALAGNTTRTLASGRSASA